MHTDLDGAAQVLLAQDAQGALGGRASRVREEQRRVQDPARTDL